MPTIDQGHESERHHSDVLDAIFDAVEQRPDAAAARSTSPFRAKALEQIDIPKQIDNLLPLTSRRFWLILAGIAVVILGSLVYSIGTVRISSVAAHGRAVAPPGISVVLAPATGTIIGDPAAEGSSIAEGGALGRIATAAGSVEVISPRQGTIWQQLVTSGEAVTAGQPMSSVLPADSGGTIVVGVPENDIESVTAGQVVNVTTPDGTTVQGVVESVGSSPTPPLVASARLGIEITEPVVLVTLRLETQVTAGEVVSAQIVLSQHSVLELLLGTG